MNKRGIVTIILSVILSLQICGLVTKADSNNSTNTANTSIVTSAICEECGLQQLQI